MAIIRVHTNDQYTTMSRHHLRDTSLSWQAMGMLSFMLSCSENFKFTIEGLGKCSASGDTATRTALKELRDKGYVNVTPVREQGRVLEWIYDIFEEPVVENPHVANPVVVSRTQRNNNIRVNNKSTSLFGDITPSKEDILSESVVDPIFEEFWNRFDKKSQRAQAERMWKKLKKADIDAIMSRVDAYVKSTPDRQFRMNPATYINPTNRRWEDEIRQPESKPADNHVWTC